MLRGNFEERRNPIGLVEARIQFREELLHEMEPFILMTKSYRRCGAGSMPAAVSESKSNTQ